MYWQRTVRWGGGGGGGGESERRDVHLEFLSNLNVYITIREEGNSHMIGGFSIFVTKML